MQQLPIDQDKLLKELNELDQLQQNHINPEQQLIIKYTLILFGVFSLVAVGIKFALDTIDENLIVVILSIIATLLCLGLAYVGKRLGFLLSAIAFLCFNCYLL